jgi:glycosyltransferase involved in cell wall biosynthesis
MQPHPRAASQNVKGYILKNPSPRSKGMLCLRIEKNAEIYPRELLLELKQHWHFFWFSAWNTPYSEIAYRDLIDIFVTWDDHAEEIRSSGRTDYIIVRGGSETFEQHNLLFYPDPDVERDVDLLYVARFTSSKRPDMAMACVDYIAKRNPACKAVFLESFASDLPLRTKMRQQCRSLGLEANLHFATVPMTEVNAYMNRSKLCLFTSDEEGLCRATVQALLAERPLLAYRHTRALTRHLYDQRFFHFYDEQTAESIGQAAWKCVSRNQQRNDGARDYLLKEKGFVFYDLAGWQENLLQAAAPLYARDGEQIDREDLIPIDDGTPFRLWRNFSLQLTSGG